MSVPAKQQLNEHTYSYVRLVPIQVRAVKYGNLVLNRIQTRTCMLMWFVTKCMHIHVLVWFVTKCMQMHLMRFVAKCMYLHILVWYITN
jgi:hypothetical protein